MPSKNIFDSFDLETTDDETSPTPHEEDRWIDKVELPPVEDDEETTDETTVEEKVEEPKKTEEPKKEEPKVDEVEEDYTYGEIFESLIKSGVIEHDPDKEYEDSEEGFSALIQDTVEKKYKSRLSSLSPTARRLIEIEEAGGDIYEAFERVGGSYYKQLDPNDKTDGEELIVDYYKAQGWDQEDIDEKLELARENPKLFAKEAKIAHKQLVASEEKEAEKYQESIKVKQKEAETKREQELVNLKTHIDSLDNIKGFKLDSKTKKDLFEYITVPDKKTGKSKLQMSRESNPEAQLFAVLLDYYNYDLKKLEELAESKATSKIRKTLKLRTDNNIEAKSTTVRKKEARTELPNLPIFNFDQED